MIKTILYIAAVFFTGFLIFSACTGFEPVALKESYMTGLHDKKDEGKQAEETGLPALKYKSGNLREGTYWWTGSSKSLSVNNGAVMEIEMEEVGPNYVPFGSDLPILDFVKQPVGIRIKARAENKDEETPILALQLDDAEGYQANARRPLARIDIAPEFKDYYFDCRGIWSQNWPNNHSVDGRMINKILFFTNPGGKPYTGKIIISEIQVIPADSIKKNPLIKAKIGKEYIGMLDDFSGDISAWYGGEKFKISKTADSALKVIVDMAGPKYESFGYRMQTLNMKNTPKIRAKIKIDSKQPVQFRLDCKDVDGYITNANPATVMLYPKDTVYKYVFFDFKSRWKQAWPDTRTVDAERITELLVFINPGNAPWTGTIYIDEIEIVKPSDPNTKNDQLDMTR